DAHGDGAARDVFAAEEIAGGVHAGDAIERDQAGAAVAPGARLVEADVTGAADAEDLKVDPSGVADGALIRLAVLGDLFDRKRAVGEVNVAGFNIDMIE